MIIQTVPLILFCLTQGWMDWFVIVAVVFKSGIWNQMENH